jgi:hypothetical protein
MEEPMVQSNKGKIKEKRLKEDKNSKLTDK